MKIAIASGKGGTGKTTLAVTFSYYISETGHNVTLIDCDVEEPNAHLFIMPDWTDKKSITVTVPEEISGKCNGCGKCSDICQYKAILPVNGSLMTFPEMCHSCLGCFLVCDEHALSKKHKEIGILEEGTRNRISFIHGKLNVGELNVPPMIRSIKEKARKSEITIIDCPPGTSCAVVEAVKDADRIPLLHRSVPPGDAGISIGQIAVGAAKLEGY